MDPIKFRHWLEQIYATEAGEISCSECLDLLAVYVDLELDGAGEESRLLPVKKHIYQCKVCREEYELLRELALSDRQGGLPRDETG
jgi:hypothetical protein